jgi:uncharacterized membrane protein affecting hemolysin expression
MRNAHPGSWLVAAVLALVLAFATTASTWSPGLQQAGNRQAEVDIRDLLRQYSTALERLDADAVKKVQPSIEVENLRKAFREMRALNVTIEDVRVLAADEAAARVSCRVTQILTPKAGSKQTTAATRVMRLRRQAGSWSIESFER